MEIGYTNCTDFLYPKRVIKRAIEKKFSKFIKTFPIVALSGPRQSGKTTLVKKLFQDGYRYVSLEDLDSRAFAQSDPRGFLSEYDKKVIIDEAQLVPELFSFLQEVVDRDQMNGQYVLTGSPNFLQNEKIKQSLSGRTAFLHLLPLSFEEIKKAKLKLPSLEDVLYRGFYPRLYSSKVKAADWYANYIRTYDLRLIKNIHDLNTFQIFLKMCASRTGQLIDYTSLGNDCGISHNTVKNWLNILESSFIIFFLRPHFKNYGKRLVKSPKIYFYDTGLLCHLLDIQSSKQLQTHYLKGGIFESFVMSELMKGAINEGKDPHLYFWRDNHGNEVDCIIEAGETLMPIEIKSSKTVSPDFFENLTYWNKLSGANANSYLIYGGDLCQKRSNSTVLSWNSIDKLKS